MYKPTRISPVGRVIAVVAAISLMTVAFFVGAVIFVAFFMLFVTALAAVRIRLWWLQRKFKGRHQRSPHAGGARLIEGEYVIRRRENNHHRW